MTLHRPRLAGLLTTIIILAGAGCAPGSDQLEVTDAWARNSPAVATAGAVYLRIANATAADDRLVDVEVDAAVAAEAELHETVAATPSGSGMGMGSSGAPMMEMREVDEIEIPARSTVVLEPGGYHIMLMDLAEPLALGSRIEVTLVFEVAGEIDVTAEVRESAP